jgi:hypothetical protein
MTSSRLAAAAAVAVVSVSYTNTTNNNVDNNTNMCPPMTSSRLAAAAAVAVVSVSPRASRVQKAATRAARLRHFASQKRTGSPDAEFPVADIP